MLLSSRLPTIEQRIAPTILRIDLSPFLLAGDPTGYAAAIGSPARGCQDIFRGRHVTEGWAFRQRKDGRRRAVSMNRRRHRLAGTRTVIRLERVLGLGDAARRGAGEGLVAVVARVRVGLSEQPGEDRNRTRIAHPAERKNGLLPQLWVTRLDRRLVEHLRASRVADVRGQDGGAGALIEGTCCD